MTAPNGPEWSRIRSLEDVLGLLALVEDRLKAIRIQAWNEGSWDRVFEDAITAQAELERLQAMLSARWAGLVEQARDE